MEEVLRCFDAFDATTRKEDQRDWVNVSRAMWEPIAVGRRFYLVPDWRSDAPPAGRFSLRINPGRAFGSGRHESTQLCLEALERHVRPCATVLDVGAGTGILSAAAMLLGAGLIAACDIDPEALAVARERLAGRFEAVHLFLGSAGAVRSESSDVIVANINAGGVIMLAAEFWRCLRPGGMLVASGFERHEAPDVCKALAHLRYGPVEETCKGEWTLLEAQKSNPRE